MTYLISKIRKYYVYILIADLFLIFFIAYETFFSHYYWEGESEKMFSISPGKNLNEIVKDLKDSDIIPNSFLFKLAVKLTGKEDEIISNDYLFKNGMSNYELIRFLTDKNSIQFVRFTIPPGYNLRQISRLAQKKLNISPDKFLNEASNDSLINILGLKGQINNLEGFLFPDTYNVAPFISEKKLILLLFSEFRKKVLENEKISSQMTQRKLSLLQTITLASIVEGETKLDDEKPIIAGVYLNRLDKGMKLEADPTIQYILPGGPKSRLLFEDLKINSPYNTYLFKGLPPGPINNPGLASINAVLNPTVHRYLFFVATGEGGHNFSENYQQHLEAIKQYKATLKKQSNNK